MGCHLLLQGIFPSQPGSPALRADSLPTEPQVAQRLRIRLPMQETQERRVQSLDPRDPLQSTVHGVAKGRTHLSTAAPEPLTPT